jgi:hypothetical protein
MQGVLRGNSKMVIKNLRKMNMRYNFLVCSFLLEDKKLQLCDNTEDNNANYVYTL